MGANFAAGATIAIGGQQAVGTTFVSSTEVTTVAPPSPISGPVSVTVTNPDGTSSTSGGSGQLLSNPGFELGSQYWKPSGSGTLTIATNAANAHAGSAYADFVSSSGQHPVLLAADSSGNPMYVPIVPGNVITFGGWAYRVSGNGLARFAIELTDANKANPSWVVTTPNNVTAALWTRLTGSYTVSTGKAFMRFYADLYGATMPSEARFDDANLTVNNAGSGGFSYIPPPSITGITPNSGYIGGGTVATVSGAGFVSGAVVKFGAVPATRVVFVNSTQLIATTPANPVSGTVGVVVTNPDGQSGALGAPMTLVVNPGFESGITNWALRGGGTATVKTGSTMARSGTNYLDVTSAPGNHPQVYNANASNQGLYFPVQPGDLVTFGGWTSRVSGDGSARWTLVSYDANKSNPSYPHPFPSTATSGTWTEQFGNYLVPAGRSFVSFYIEIYANSSPAEALFDDGFLIRQTGGFTYSSLPPTLISITIAPTNPTIAPGGSQQFTATGTYNDGSTQDLTTLVTWSSSNPAVASISNAPGTQGLCSGVAAGTAMISASFQSITGNATLTVASALDGFFTYQGSNLRLGGVLNENLLTPLNVNVNTFGKKYEFDLDGWAFGQPLYVKRLTLGGVVRNVVYVATMHDSVYAFDADHRQAEPLWQRSFIDPSHGITSIPMSDVGKGDLYPEIGIVSTPVIDPASQTIYVVAATKEPGPAYFWKLHALDLTTGVEKPGSPAVISAVGFSAQKQMNRPALLLSNGVVYVAFGSYEDVAPYHGWLFAYNAQTLQSAALPLNTTPTGSAAGIWSGGSGPAVDEVGNIYFGTGNGTFDLDSSGANMGDSMVKAGIVSGAIQLLDYFTPFNQSSLAFHDVDFGSGGTVILPAPYAHVAIIGTKDGNIYVINRDHLGGVRAFDNSQAVQVFPVGGAVRSSPAIWNGTLYIGPSATPMSAYSIDSTGQLSGPVSTTAHAMGYPSVTPIVSANGSGNGIVWVLERYDTLTTILRAYDATNLANELYDSQQNVDRDAVGPGTRFCTPLVFDGKVFVPTQTSLLVYSLL